MIRIVMLQEEKIRANLPLPCSLTYLAARAWGMELVVSAQTIGATFSLESETKCEKFYGEGRT